MFISDGKSRTNETPEKKLLDLFWCLIDSHVRIWSADVTLLWSDGIDQIVFEPLICAILISVWIKKRNNATKAPNSVLSLSTVSEFFWLLKVKAGFLPAHLCVCALIFYRFTSDHRSRHQCFCLRHAHRVHLCWYSCFFFWSLSSDGSVVLIALQ